MIERVVDNSGRRGGDVEVDVEGKREGGRVRLCRRKAR